MEKIALEEHFRVPGMPEYSGAGQYLSDETAANRIDELLADFDDLRLGRMDEANVTKAILSHTFPGVGAATDKKKAVDDTKKINDFLVEKISHHPDRFGGRHRRTIRINPETGGCSLGLGSRDCNAYPEIALLWALRSLSESSDYRRTRWGKPALFPVAFR